MQIFACPWCGPRADEEFRYAGDADRPRPALECSDAEWAAYLYLRANARGAARELWVHGAGCGRWIAIARDTATHEISDAEPLNR